MWYRVCNKIGFRYYFDSRFADPVPQEEEVAPIFG